MKSLASLFALITVILVAFSPAAAAAPATDLSCPNPPTPTPSPKKSKWSVRVEVLMVAVPEANALKLIPDLFDPVKIDQAVGQMMAAIERKEAALLACPMVETLDGERAISEEILEKRYPTTFELPTFDKFARNEVPRDPKPVEVNGMPSAFETRNIGVTLEVEPKVMSNGKQVRLSLVPQRVMFEGYESFDGGRTESGKMMKLDQPQFSTTKVTTSVTLQSGQRRLLAIHKIRQPENHLEFTIVRAVINPLE